MKKSLLFLLIIFLIYMVNANSYQIEFNQVDKEMSVKEYLNGEVISEEINSDGLSFSGNEIYFLKKILFEEDYSSFEGKLTLDKGCVISNKNIFPEGYLLTTDGERISIIWKKENIKRGDSFAIFVLIKNTNSNYNYLIIAIVILSVLISVYYVYKRIILKNSFREYLIESEKKIIEELTKSEKKELWQKQLQIATGFSKAKISRLMRNLESRRIIEKIPLGNTNKIKLK